MSQTVFTRLLQLRAAGRTALSDELASDLQRAAVNAARDVLRSRRAQPAASFEDAPP